MSMIESLPFEPDRSPKAPVSALSRGMPADLRPALTADEVGIFREDGFLVLPRACDESEVRDIRALLMNLFALRAGREEGNQFDMLSLDKDGESIQPQIVKPSLYAPALLRTAHFRRMRDVARQLLGHDAELCFDHSILKLAGKRAATPWHQDEAYNLDSNFDYDQISFWMPLQDVSEENGCMRYVPGSNRGPLLPHRSLNDDPRIQAIECPVDSFDESAARAYPVPAGWCILHDGRTLHSALPNGSNTDRLVYVLAFRGALRPRREPQRLTWLQSRRTASDERSQRWRRQGGVLVVLWRRVRKVLKSDLRTLPFKLRRLLHTLRMNRMGDRRPE